MTYWVIATKNFSLLKLLWYWSRILFIYLFIAFKIDPCYSYSISYGKLDLFFKFWSSLSFFFLITSVLGNFKSLHFSFKRKSVTHQLPQLPYICGSLAFILQIFEGGEPNEAFLIFISNYWWNHTQCLHMVLFCFIGFHASFLTAFSLLYGIGNKNEL